MRLSSDHIFIFDCDGVILDSNKLKLDAMRKAISIISDDKTLIDQCIDYFSKNFGKSRFHHVRYFIKNIFHINDEKLFSEIYEKIISSYSNECKKLYMNAALCENVEVILNHIKGKSYVVSGSDEVELNWVFEQRDLNHYFCGIYGSPRNKTEIIHEIMEKNKIKNKKYIFFGDAMADYDAASDNGIKFIFYEPYSNIKNKIKIMSEENNINVLYSWSELDLC